MQKMHFSPTTILGLAFFAIFFGFNGTQQFVTSFFHERGLGNLGFASLALIYLSFILTNAVSPWLITRFGPRQSMVGAALLYAGYIASLLTANVPLVLLVSVLLGAAGTVLWTSQNVYLVVANAKTSLGREAGNFNLLFSLGSAAGALGLGLLMTRINYTAAFAFFSISPLIGAFLLWKLPQLQSTTVPTPIFSFVKTLRSPTAMRLASIWLAFNLTYGLVISTVPLSINQQLGAAWVGILSSAFYLMPVFISHAVGSWTDAYGRKKGLSLGYVAAIMGLVLLLPTNVSWLVIPATLCLALNFALMRTLTFALVGDVSPDGQLENFSALVWTSQGIGTLSAILLGTAVSGSLTYGITLGITCIGILLILPLRKYDMGDIQAKLTKEIH